MFFSRGKTGRLEVGELENRRAPHEDDDDGDGEFRKLLTELDRATKEVNPSPIYRSKTSSLIIRSFPEIFPSLKFTNSNWSGICAFPLFLEMPLVGRRVQLVAFWLAVIMSTSPGNEAGAFSMDNDSTAGETPKSEVPRLKASDPDSNLPSIKLGETIRLVEMGPIIINTDGK
jgi:hypothetical protein